MGGREDDDWIKLLRNETASRPSPTSLIAPALAFYGSPRSGVISSLCPANLCPILKHFKPIASFGIGF